MHDNHIYCILKSNGQEHSKFQKHQTKTNWENFRKVNTSAQSLFIKKQAVIMLQAMVTVGWCDVHATWH